MPAAPTLSVGIPTYNQADFLEETLESLLRQTRPPDEILISDHHSTDATPEIVARYVRQSQSAGVPIRSVQPPPGVNLTGQYNFTLTSQTCDWITLLSSDDIAYPRFCETLLRGAARDRSAVLVRAGWQNIDADGKHVSHNYMLSVPRVEHPPATLISQKNGPKVSFAAFAVKREAYLQSGPILASIESLADWALFIQLAPFGSYIYESEIISGYRVGHDGNKFRNRCGMWIRDEVRLFTEVFPLAAERAGMNTPAQLAWIAEADADNFLRYLAAASREFAPDERAAIAPLFDTWAFRTGSEVLLRSFAAGEQIHRSVSLSQRAKTMVRPLAQRLASQLHKR